jgi:hypothetical protein
MREFLLRNKTDQVQSVSVREAASTRLHDIHIVARGATELDVAQITRDVRSKVSKGIFKALNIETGETIDISIPEVSPEPAEVTEGSKSEEKLPEDNESKDDQSQDLQSPADQTKDDEITDDGTTEDEFDLPHLGGGYYELPNGEKVRGRDKAIEAFKALQEQE